MEYMERSLCRYLRTDGGEDIKILGYKDIKSKNTMQTPYKKLKVGEIVYKIVKKIPKGKVASYGLISKIANEEIKKFRNEELLKVTPRYVGYLLHNNPDPDKIPCHRVVDRNGKVAKHYKFGGWREQKRKLTEEGVSFRDERQVEIKFLILKF